MLKTAGFCALFLSVALLANAETIIVEYPDHFYVESTGIPGKETTTPPAVVSEKVKSDAKPVVERLETKKESASRPVVSPEYTQPPLSNGARRASMEQELERLKRERGELLMPRQGESLEATESRQRDAMGRLRKINKLSNELLKIPADGSQQLN